MAATTSPSVAAPLSDTLLVSSDRDVILPVGWVPGNAYRLTPLGRLRHLFYAAPFEGLPQEPLPKSLIMWDVYAAHCIKGIFITEVWTSVQFCPQPTTYPDSRVWVIVRHLTAWYAQVELLR